MSLKTDNLTTESIIPYNVMITQRYILYVLFITLLRIQLHHQRGGYIVTDHMQLTDYIEDMQLPCSGLHITGPFLTRCYERHALVSHYHNIGDTCGFHIP
jgi:hypothetical protein